MWEYQKMLAHPIKIKNPDAKAAQVIMSQLGGPNGEMGASTRYLNQRYSMPYDKVKAMLTDIGTEEPEHLNCQLRISKKLGELRVDCELQVTAGTVAADSLAFLIDDFLKDRL
jgi:spore coat protein JC